MKRILFGLTLILILTRISVFAIDPQISITYASSETQYVMDRDNAYFELRMLYCPAGTYTVEYSIDAFENSYKEKFVVDSINNTVKRVYLDKLPNAKHNLSVRLIKDDVVMFTGGKTIGIMNYYTSRYLEDYSLFGVAVEYNTSDDATGSHNLTTNLLSKCGVQHMRGGPYPSWSRIEKQKGFYDYTKIKQWGLGNLFNKDNLSFVALGGFSNGLYSSASMRLESREKIEAHTKYLISHIDEFGSRIRFVEPWNEPDLKQYYKGDNYGIEYSNAAINSAVGVKEKYPDMPVTIGGVSGGGNKYLRKVLNDETYPYIDGITFHPYYSSITNFDDGKFQNFLNSYTIAADNQGGWLDSYITEMGWHLGTYTEEKVAEFVPKLFITGDKNGYDGVYWYHFRPADPKAGKLALVSIEGVPHMGYYSFAQYGNRINGSFYIGNMKLGDNLIGHLYVRDLKPLLVIWATDEKGAEYSFGDEKISLFNQYGDPINYDGRIDVGQSVIYVEGLSKNWIYKAATEQLTAFYDEFIKKWDNKCDTSEMQNIRERICLYPDTLVGAKELFDAHYALGDKLIEQYKNGRIESEKNLALMLWQLNIQGKKLGDYYASKVSKTTMTVKTASVYSLEKAVQQKKGEYKNGALRFTDKILRYAKLYSESAKDISEREENPAKYGLVSKYNLLSEKVYRWGKMFIELETVETNKNILTYANPSTLECFPLDTKTVNFTVENRRGVDVEGIVTVYDEGGEKVTESKNVYLKNGELLSENFDIIIPATLTAGEHFYKIVIENNGEKITERTLPIIVSNIVETKLEVARTVFSELESIGVNVTNVSDEKQKFNLVLIPPKDWDIEEGKDVELETKESKSIKFHVNSKKQVPFNEYIFTIQLYDENNQLVSEKKLPLDFTVFMENNDVINVNEWAGDIASWANAYPIHINPPKNPERFSDWKDSNIAARSYVKFDSQNMYVLVDVFDDLHANNTTQDAVWSYDSVQGAVDTLNNKSNNYDTDDLPFMLAYTGQRKNEIILSPRIPNDKGELVRKYEYFDGETVKDLLRIIRDNKNCTTRYLYRIPKEKLYGLSLAKGIVVGYNINVNDADAIDRERYIQFTRGIGDVHRPLYHENFTFVGYESGIAADEACDWVDLTINFDNK